MDLGFGDEVADFYYQYRRGYPPAVIDTHSGTMAGDGARPCPVACGLAAWRSCGPGRRTARVLARGKRAAEPCRHRRREGGGTRGGAQIGVPGAID
jgi:hypothetical protein